MCDQVFKSALGAFSLEPYALIVWTPKSTSASLSANLLTAAKVPTAPRLVDWDWYWDGVAQTGRCSDAVVILATSDLINL